MYTKYKGLKQAIIQISCIFPHPGFSCDCSSDAGVTSTVGASFVLSSTGGLKPSRNSNPQIGTAALRRVDRLIRLNSEGDCKYKPWPSLVNTKEEIPLKVKK